MFGCAIGCDRYDEPRTAVWHVRIVYVSTQPTDGEVGRSGQGLRVPSGKKGPYMWPFRNRL